MSRWVGGMDRIVTSSDPGWGGTTSLDRRSLGEALDFLKEITPLFQPDAKRIQVRVARAAQGGTLYASAEVTERE